MQSAATRPLPGITIIAATLAGLADRFAKRIKALPKGYVTTRICELLDVAQRILQEVIGDAVLLLRDALSLTAVHDC